MARCSLALVIFSVLLPAQDDVLLAAAAPEDVGRRAGEPPSSSSPDRPTKAGAEEELSFFRRAVRFFGGGEADRRLQTLADYSYGMRSAYGYGRAYDLYGDINFGFGYYDDGDDWQYGDDWVTLVDDEPSSLDTDDDDWVTGVDDLFGGFGGADDFFGDGGFGFLDDANYDADCAEYGDECSSLDCCGGESCFRKNDDFAYCLEACPAQADWACYVPPCAGKGDRCDADVACCGSNSCFWKVGKDYGECQKNCPDDDKFECYVPPCAGKGDRCDDETDCCGSNSLCRNQIFNTTSMCAYATVSTQGFWLCFETSMRAIDSSKNQPNRLRFDRDREF
jgi:hypothetical protein